MGLAFKFLLSSLAKHWKPLVKYVLPVLLVMAAAYWLYLRGYNLCQAQETVKVLEKEVIRYKEVVRHEETRKRADLYTSRSRSDAIKRLQSHTFGKPSTSGDL